MTKTFRINCKVVENRGLQYNSGRSDKGIRTFDFAAKTQFL